MRHENLMFHANGTFDWLIFIKKKDSKSSLSILYLFIYIVFYVDLLFLYKNCTETTIRAYTLTIFLFSIFGNKERSVNGLCSVLAIGLVACVQILKYHNTKLHRSIGH